MNLNGQSLEPVPGLSLDVLRSSPEGLLRPAHAEPPSAFPIAAVAPLGADSPFWMSTVTADSDGRIAVRAALRILDWTGNRVTVRADPQSGMVMVTAGGPQVVTAKGMLRLPIAMRRACGITAGAQVLMVCLEDRDGLRIFTSDAVQRWIRGGLEPHKGGFG